MENENRKLKDILSKNDSSTREHDDQKSKVNKLELQN